MTLPGAARQSRSVAIAGHARHSRARRRGFDTLSPFVIPRLSLRLVALLALLASASLLGAADRVGKLDTIRDYTTGHDLEVRLHDNGDGTFSPGVSSSNIVTTATPSSVSVTTTSGAVLAANAARKDAVITNYGTVGCFLARSATAVVGQGIYLAAGGGAYNIDANNLYRGQLTAITASGTATLAVSEGQ